MSLARDRRLAAAPLEDRVIAARSGSRPVQYVTMDVSDVDVIDQVPFDERHRRDLRWRGVLVGAEPDGRARLQISGPIGGDAMSVFWIGAQVTADGDAVTSPHMAAREGRE